MTCTTLPTSTCDSVSDVVTLDMTDDDTKPAASGEEEEEEENVFEKEGSLNSSMITIIISLQETTLAVHRLTESPTGG